MTALSLSFAESGSAPVAKTLRLPWVIAAALGLSAVAGAAILLAAGMRLEPSGFLRFLALAGAMAGLSWWCTMRRLDQRLGAAAAIVGTATLSLMLCGIVANAGLRLGVPLADARLARADAALGFSAGAIIRAIAEHPRLTQVLSLLYNSSGIAVVGLIGWTLARRSVRKAWELAGTVIVAMQAVAVASPALPALGAMRHFALEALQGHGLPRGAGVYQWPAFTHFYSGDDAVVQLADLGGVVAFPSFHAVLGLMITQALAGTRLRWLSLAWTAGILLSAIPMGGHYVVDLAAGFVIWLAAATIARRAVAQ